MHDPHPWGLVDDERMRLRQNLVARRRVEGLLRLLQQIIEVRR
jgi:hypothetical protein